MVTAKSAEEAPAKPKHDLNVLLAGAEDGEQEKALIMAATVTAHIWARAAATRPAPGSGEVGGTENDDRPGLVDPERWREAAQNAVSALVRPHLTFPLPGRSGNDGEGTEALAEGDEATTVKKANVAPVPVAPANTGHDTEWVFAQIERLGELKEKGLLTEEEFTAKKTDLLGRI